jgi:hypothetical protein
VIIPRLVVFRGLGSLALLAALLAGPDSPALAASSRVGGAGPLVVLDGADRLVGYPDATGSTVLREINGIWFTIPITEDGFALSTIAAGLFGAQYESTDCSGPAFIAPAFGLARYLTRLNGQIVYPSHPPVTRAINSTLSSLTGTPICSATPAPIDLPVAEPLPFDSTALDGLVAPFRLAPAGGS